MSDSNAVRGPRDGEPAKRTGPATFYRQVVAELRKVVWPTREQLSSYFVVVLVFVLIMMAIVTLLDLAFGRLAFSIFTGPND
ncbi:preprotein translocase subunit SecE [Nocardioides sp. dk4132]|uniref:preprotein translocase subunit SecE n=1 Tax=unclassified Nocardioides TaxID=2615069 RepID=UPI001294FBE4|nr:MULTISPECIES: preprotein translocase subunit SecE [unclassified Nocardioides]MQW74542.1 preprotein translocase subunit SecE [Nocardioides sp. dk4132]QGA06466.1 preprotein translocase subunit SecE [Nocardioides sp. dk884]